MPARRTLRIGSLLTVVLLGFLATDATFAEGTAYRAHHAKMFSWSAGHHASRSTSGLPNTRGAPTTDRDNASAPNNPGRDERVGKKRNMTGGVAGPDGSGVKVPLNGGATGNDAGSLETRARDANAIDTRIIAPSRLSNDNRAKGFELKNARKSIASRGSPSRHERTPGAMRGVARNAIGAPIVRPAEIRVEDSKAYGRQSAVPATGVDRSPPNSFAKSDGSVGQRSIVQPNTIPTVSSIASNRGMIDGTTFARPGFAPLGLGGPVKAFAGINGTTLRPKR